MFVWSGNRYFNVSRMVDNAQTIMPVMDNHHITEVRLEFDDKRQVVLTDKDAVEATMSYIVQRTAHTNGNGNGAKDVKGEPKSKSHNLTEQGRKNISEGMRRYWQNKKAQQA